MNNENGISAAQKSAVDALQKFYGLIVAIAFTGGMIKYIENFTVYNWTQNHSTRTLLLIAFISTIIPFYHGMERHLFQTHIDRSDIDWDKGGKPSYLLVDIIAFLIEGALLLAMGRNLGDTLVFLQLWSALLVVDILWSYQVFARQKGRKPIWIRNNVVWLLIAWTAWWYALAIFEFLGAPLEYALVYQSGAVVIAEIFRSIFDYKSHWNFYFPEQNKAKPILIYLAGPYTNDGPKNAGYPANKKKRKARFEAITDTARQLIEKNIVVYSPLTMTHPIDVLMEDDPGSDFWVDFDETFMRHCTGIYVLKLPGWKESSGVLREIQHFSDREISVTYLEPGQYGITNTESKFRSAFE